MKGLLSLGFLSLVTRATMQRAQTFQSIDFNDKILLFQFIIYYATKVLRWNLASITVVSQHIVW